MVKKNFLRDKLRGQAAIIIALSMLLLIIIVGLAIDGGSLYQQRRAAQNSSDAAALVTFRDDAYRRFYTCWFDSEFYKLSPAMVLIHEITRQSLASGINCDYMTGEHPYKLRLATGSMPLYRLQATPEQLASLSEMAAPELRFVS